MTNTDFIPVVTNGRVIDETAARIADVVRDAAGVELSPAQAHAAACRFLTASAVADALDELRTVARAQRYGTQVARAAAFTEIRVAIEALDVAVLRATAARLGLCPDSEPHHLASVVALCLRDEADAGRF